MPAVRFFTFRHFRPRARFSLSFISQGLQPFGLSFSLGVRAFSESPCGLFTVQISFCRASGVVCPCVVPGRQLYIGFWPGRAWIPFAPPALSLYIISMFLLFPLLGGVVFIFHVTCGFLLRTLALSSKTAAKLLLFFRGKLSAGKRFSKM
jgi:hypothetical protein